MTKLCEVWSTLGDDKNLFCAIIFTEKRAIAATLSSMLNVIAKEDQTFRFIKSDFIVGHGTKIASSLMHTSMKNKKQNSIMNKFRRQEVNVLVATNVVEEGIDIPKCNLIVRFDEIKTFGSYLQAKGRARAKNAHYVILVQKNELSNLSNQLQTWSHIEKYLQKQWKDRNVGNEEDYLADESLSIVHPFVVESTGAKVTMSDSVQLMHW